MRDLHFGLLVFNPFTLAFTLIKFQTSNAIPDPRAHPDNFRRFPGLGRSSWSELAPTCNCHARAYALSFGSTRSCSHSTEPRMLSSEGLGVGRAVPRKAPRHRKAASKFSDWSFRTRRVLHSPHFSFRNDLGQDFGGHFARSNAWIYLSNAKSRHSAAIFCGASACQCCPALKVDNAIRLSDDLLIDIAACGAPQGCNL